jgi:hypothetical protein
MQQMQRANACVCRATHAARTFRYCSTHTAWCPRLEQHEQP